jgi:hypothetical protein
MTGVDTEADSVGRVELREAGVRRTPAVGGEDEGGDPATLGNGWLPFTGDDGLAVDNALAALSLLPRYCATRSWKVVFKGVKDTGAEILLKSSADLDHARLEILRRSPSPPELMVGLDGWLGFVASRKRGMSMEPCCLEERSRTDL